MFWKIPSTHLFQLYHPVDWNHSHQSFILQVKSSKQLWFVECCKREVTVPSFTTWIEYQVSYKSYELFLLPFPYKPDCRRYKKSQSECKDCTLRHCLTKTDEYPEDVFMSLVGDRNLTTGLNTEVKQRIKSCSTSIDNQIVFSSTPLQVWKNRSGWTCLVSHSCSSPWSLRCGRSQAIIPNIRIHPVYCRLSWSLVRNLLSLNPLPVQKTNDRVASVCLKLETKTQKKARKDLQILRRQNAVLFMKFNHLKQPSMICVI